MWMSDVMKQSEAVKQPEAVEQPQVTVQSAQQAVTETTSQPVPQMTIVVAEPTMYDTHVKENFHIFGVASFLYACLYAFCMYKNDAGITYSLLVVGGLFFIQYCLKKLDVEMKKESRFYMISMVLLSVSTFCTDDWRIIFFNKTGVFLLTISLLLGALYETKQWNLGKYLGSIAKVCLMSIGELGKPFADMKWYCKNKLEKKNNKYLYVLMGIAITIPVFIVVFALLASADIVFNDMAKNLLKDVDFTDAYNVALIIVGVFLITYCILTYLSKKTIKEEIDESRKGEPLIAIPVVTILSLLYIVFSGIQIVYLFMGRMQLPDGYTYAEYAREGFFQLLAVSIINLIIVLIGLYFFKPSKVLKVVLTIMSLCTFVMIASSAMRMMIYIMYYYLTFLRIFVLWSLVVLFLLFVGVIAYIAKESFPLFRYSMIVVTCLYIALSFSHPDYWIAKVNLDSTKATRSEFFRGAAYEDYYLLCTLSADAAPVMIEWMEEEGYSLRDYEPGYNVYHATSNARNHEYEASLYLRRIREDCTDVGIRNFNVSRFMADAEIMMRRSQGM